MQLTREVQPNLDIMTHLNLCLKPCVSLFKKKKKKHRSLTGDYVKGQYGKYPNRSIGMGVSQPEPMTELLMSFSDLD